MKSKNFPLPPLIIVRGLRLLVNGPIDLVSQSMAISF